MVVLSNAEGQKLNPDEEAKERSLLAGTRLAHPLPGDEVVISGVAGRFPDSDDIYHFRDNLYNKVDLISFDNRRWEPNHPEVPHRTGKVNHITKFDAGFFGIHHRQVNSMDPMCRMILERAFEAIIDAGINPKELRGTKTGVFIGACFSETEKTWFYERLQEDSYAVTGCSRSMLANRISYFMGLEGPSFTVDTACSSSSYALEYAYRSIREGTCDSAIVGGTNLCLHPIVSLQFARLGVLSKDGSCKSFDKNANGYVRSESIAAIFLQRAKDSRRIYAQVVHAKTNCDGFKEQGITYPSGADQKQLLIEFYEECKVDPTTLDFLEAHATGTKVGDPEELSALDQIFCTNRKTPLPVGSVKSNLGHTEPVSGMCSIVKVIIGMENGYIPPNINYTEPREGAEVLEQKRMVVVTDKTPWPYKTGLAGVNSFGFGGANCHILLRCNQKVKVNNGLPKDDIPRLVCLNGRNQYALKMFVEDLRSRPLDAEYVALLNEAFKDHIPGFKCRGYSILAKSGEISSDIKQFDEIKRPLYVVFGNPGSHWLEVGRELFALPHFAATIQKAHDLLNQKNVNITDVIMNTSASFPEKLTLLGGLVVQLGVVDLFRTLEIESSYIVGVSLGELTAAYCDGVLTFQQVLSSAHAVLYLDGATEKSQALKGDSVVQSLRKILPQSIKPSGKWITAQSLSKKDVNGNQISPEYFANALFHPGEIGNITNYIKRRAVILDITDGKIAKYLSIKGQADEIDIIEVFSHSTKGKNLVNFLQVVGRLFEFGVDPKPNKIYPTVQFPVSRGTPMLSPLMKWEHEKDWHVSFYNDKDSAKCGERVLSLNVNEVEWSFLTGHVIDGRNLFPATGYLNLVWETLAMVLGMLMSDMQIVFENVRFSRATNIPKGGSLEMLVMIQKASGNFEVIEGGVAVVTGRVARLDDVTKEVTELPIPAGATGSDMLALNSKDIYKELKLRGYHYKGQFRALQSCDNTGSKGVIAWNGSYIAFMDNMLQLPILNMDTRNLYVPTGIERLIIDARRHVQCLQEAGEKPALPVYFYQDANIVKSGGIEIRGLRANSIPRRKPLGEPVLETYKFIPNETTLTTFQSLTVNMQLLLENNYGIKIKVVELHDDATKEEAEPLAPTIHTVLGNQPLIQPEMLILSNKTLTVNNATVEDKKLELESNCALVVATNILSRPEVVKNSFTALKENGFLLSREDLTFDPSAAVVGQNDLTILTVHTTETEKLVLLRKTVSPKSSPVVVKVSSDTDSFGWLIELQEAVKSDKAVIVYAENEPLSGVIGLVNCIRREPGGENVRCVFIADDAPKFDINSQLYRNQLKKNLAVNIHKDGKWGTYRHLPLEENVLVEADHSYVNTLVRGDLSSLRWIEGSIKVDKVNNPEKIPIQVYYSPLNFRDIMVASGRLTLDAVEKDRLQHDFVQGFEYSGRNLKGERVMGFARGIATCVLAMPYFSWHVPDDWTMEEAATIPVVYSTALYSLFTIGKLNRGESILIHAGSGGVGLAAIYIALYYGCDIYTTVGTKEKREYLLKTFPQLKESHIGNSRDVTFEQMILRETHGRGVDIVLNSLAEEKLLASLRCLAPGGRFLEIGKFDLSNNNPVPLLSLSENRSYHGVLLDSLFNAEPEMLHNIWTLVNDHVKNGCIKPLHTKIFAEDEVEQAFRFMASGKHIGKVLIKIRDEEPEKIVKPVIKKQLAVPKYYCDSEYSYVILGGLGGFGLELADWLVVRGARKVVLTSRTGLRTGYQAMRIRVWRSYGVKVQISTADVTTEEGCTQLMNEANELGPVQAIFNLAVILKDALLENQTVDTYRTSFGPKANATIHLDKVTRKLCPVLRDFVIFSSVSCGRGNAGQTNYGMANSIMERICEKRKNEGLPALAVEWGAIGEVGLVADMQEEQTELEIGGTLQQRVCSCLEVLDIFLRQNEPIVASMVVAEKKSGAGGADNVVDAVLNILGLRDLKQISLHSTLAELGMDSMMAVEIKQTLEREFEVFLTAQDIRSMTFSRLQEIAQEKEQIKEDGRKEAPKDVDDLPEPILMLLRNMGDEKLADHPLLRLTSLVSEETPTPKVFLMPGLEGMSPVMEPLAVNLNVHAFCLQFRYGKSNDQIHEIAKDLFPHVQGNLPKNSPFTLIAYSFGSMVAMELAGLLEKEGRIGKIIMIDGSPDLLLAMAKQQLNTDSEAEFETSLLCAIMSFYMPIETIVKLKGPVFACNNFEERMKLVIDNSPSNAPHSEEYLRAVGQGVCRRLQAVVTYKPKFYSKIKSTVILFRPTRSSVSNIANDYGLNDLCEKEVEIRFFEGNHLTILENQEVANTINDLINPDVSSVTNKETLLSEKSSQNAKQVTAS
ncbi:fatty acid synthase-like [Agrilus planipennis]|uniref:Fatty acid synthase n=1 Tax=Agrilus planipennis TaxID=224129 RepID=A0A1W4XV87_AGRPL|nr:fatty acid synthase-like [Agrilus planipennis]